MNSSDPSPDENSKLSFMQTVFSVFAALFGVQKEENRARDFEKGSALTFIIVGIIVVVLFVLSLVLIVSVVIDQ